MTWLHVSINLSQLSAQNFSLLLVLEVSFLDHGNNGIVNGSLVVKSHQHLLLELQVRDLCTNGNSSLDSLLNSLAQICEFLWRLIIFGIRHTTGSSIQSWDLEEPMRFLHVLNLDNWIEVHLCNGFWDSDNSLKLTDCNGNAISLLRNFLLSWLRPICNIHILKHMASFFCQLWSNFVLGITYVLSQ